MSIVNSQIYSNTASYVCNRLQNFPLPRWDFHMCCALCLQGQGGGVFINSGTVTLSSCTITGNFASGVRAHAQNFPLPYWDALLTCPNRLSSMMMGAASIYQYGLVRASCA